MTYEFRPGLREDVGLLLGLGGPSGSGKTYTAFRLAKGIVDFIRARGGKGGPGKFAVIDTEGRRARHYGRPSLRFDFDFDHLELNPPYRPEHFLGAIRHAEAAGYPAVIVDSFSDEWAGEGGMLDWHDEELDRLVQAAVATAERYKRDPPDEGWLREKMNTSAWIRPKVGHKGMVSRLRYTRLHVIFCMRAEERLRIEQQTDDKGRKKTVYIQAKDLEPRERWTPICCHNPEFMYELTLSAVMTPEKPGVPIFLKLQEQHRGAFTPDQPITEATGAALAAWAMGEEASLPAAPGKKPAAPKPSTSAPSAAVPVVPAGQPAETKQANPEAEGRDRGAPPATGEHPAMRAARGAATMGTDNLQTWWKRQPIDIQRALEAAKNGELKKIAAEADARFEKEEADSKKSATADETAKQEELL